jgi:hypothetical protein
VVVNPGLTAAQLDKPLHGVARTLSPRTKMARIYRAIPFVTLWHWPQTILKFSLKIEPPTRSNESAAVFGSIL